MADLKTWKDWSCYRSDMDKDGARASDVYFTCDFKRNFAEISIFKNINIHLTYGYYKTNADDDTGTFQIAITQHNDVTFDRIYDGEKKVKGFICTDKDKIFEEIKKIFKEDSFLKHHFTEAFE